MIGSVVKFQINGEGVFTGTIKDKVNIPLRSGEGYCPFDNYMIVTEDKKVHYVNPINVISVISQQETAQQIHKNTLFNWMQNDVKNKYSGYELSIIERYVKELITSLEKNF